MIVFIPRTEPENKGVQQADWEWLPRLCPNCGRQAVVGHGRRRKQAHDRDQAWIRIRRAHCNHCEKTITVLPAWSLPYTHYSLPARGQALSSVAEGARWEEASPPTKDPDRVADPATIRRWCQRRVESIQFCLALFWNWPARIRLPTILAWDWRAALRILLVEASPT